MQIVCPYCGARDAAEFAVQGEVAGARPTPTDFGEADRDAFHDYVHLRVNEHGPTREYWYHAAGCRRWLVVTRDTRDHAILKTGFAAP
jgi:sarcosine oxidase subunit delta